MSSNAWVKIIGFVAMAMMLGMLGNLLLDPGLGRADDESRRVTHPGGFSIVAPLGWTSSTTENADGTAGTLSVAAQTRIGFPPTIVVNRLPPGATSLAETDKNSVPTTFQGQPARSLTRSLRNHWAYVYAFTRDQDGGHYEITVTSGVTQDLEHGPLRPFLDTFRPAQRHGDATTQRTTPPAAG